MGKRRIRKVQTTIYIAGEGHRERAFLDFINDTFSTELSRNNTLLKIEEEDLGGNPTKRIKLAIINKDFDYSITILDDDVEMLEKDIEIMYSSLSKSWCTESKIHKLTPLSRLQEYNPNNKNPIIIVCQPLNFDSVIIQFLGHELPILHSTNLESNQSTLKKSVCGILQLSSSYQNEYDYYKNNITKQMCLTRAKKIPQLNFLFKLLKLI